MTYPLAYSTLGSPDWTFAHTVEQAAANGYQALEVRVYNGEIIPPTLPAAEIAQIRATLEAHNVGIVALGLSTRFNAPDAATRRQNVDDLRQYIALADALDCPMVRTFGGEPQPGSSLDEVVTWVAEALNECAPWAEQHGIGILLETHDAFARSEIVARALAQIPSTSVGAVWDVHHPYRMGETIDQVWANIGPRVKHIHMKDATQRPDGTWQLVPMGEGEVPCRAILARLYAEDYAGAISAEWEKKWHPEIAEPEVAMPQHAQVLRQWMAEIEKSG
ncbi:MAG: sugar phosphate isomerase/epimerase family protein [Litorilinea sp.]